MINDSHINRIIHLVHLAIFYSKFLYKSQNNQKDPALPEDLHLMKTAIMVKIIKHLLNY